MEFDSIEEKVIYEKLSKATAPRGTPSADELRALLTSLQEQGWYTSSGKLPSQGLVQHVKVFVKRCARKLVYWYVEPLCRRQSDFNLAVIKAMAMLADRCDSLSSRVSALDGQNEKMRAVIAGLKRQNVELRTQLTGMDNVVCDGEISSVAEANADENTKEPLWS